MATPSWVANLGALGAPGTITLARNVIVGRRVFVIGLGNLTAVSDSKGNSYSQVALYGNIEVWSAHVSTQLNTGTDSITVTGGFGCAAMEWQNVHPSTPIDALSASGSGSIDFDPLVSSLSAISDGSLTVSDSDRGFLYCGAIEYVLRAVGVGGVSLSLFLPGGGVANTTGTSDGLTSSPSNTTYRLQVGVPSASPGTYSTTGQISVAFGPGDLNHQPVNWDLFLLVVVGTSASATAYDVCEAYEVDGQVVQALVDGGTLKVRRYDDNEPPAVASTVTVDTDVFRCCLRRRRSNVLDLTYLKGTTVYLRSSRDGGRTWSSTTTVGTGYAAVTHAWDERSGHLAVAVFTTSGGVWSLLVGTLGSDGVTWSFSSPAQITTTATSYGVLIPSDMGWWFLHSASGGTTLRRTRKIANAGTAIWTSFGLITSAVPVGLSALWDERAGLFALIRGGSTGAFVELRTLDAAGTGFTGVGLSQTVVSANVAGVSLLRRADGSYEAAYVTTTGALTRKRNRKLGVTSGSWV